MASSVRLAGVAVVLVCALCILPGHEAAPVSEETKEGAGLFGPSVAAHVTAGRQHAAQHKHVEAIQDATEAHDVRRAVKAEVSAFEKKKGPAAASVDKGVQMLEASDTHAEHLMGQFGKVTKDLLKGSKREGSKHRGLKLSKVQKALPVLTQSLHKLKALERSEQAESATIVQAAAKTGSDQNVAKVAARGEKAHGKDSKLTDILLRVTSATASTLEDWKKVAVRSTKSAQLLGESDGSAHHELADAQHAMAKEMMQIEEAGRKVRKASMREHDAKAKPKHSAHDQERAMSKQVRKKLATALAKLQTGAAAIKAREAGEVQAMGQSSH